jgi:imidazolonepropionase-like amidohydrolase
MRRRDQRGELLETVEDPIGMNRREFVQTATAVSAGLLAGAAGVTSFPELGYASAWTPVSFPKLLLYNCRLFDGIHRQLQEDRVVLVQEGRIEAIAPRGDLGAFRSYKGIDLEGRTLLPGLIDNHVHITVPFMYDVNLRVLMQMNQQIARNFRNCIMSGVTTVRDVGGFPGKILEFRAMADSNEIPGPRVISALSPIAARRGDELGAPERASYFTNPIIKWFLGGNYAERPTGVEEIEEACDRMIALGAQWLKTLHQEHPYTRHPRRLPNHTEEGYRAILEKGRANGIKCALHEPLVSGFKKGVDLGFDTLEHMPMDAVIPDALIDEFMSKDMAIMPTVMIYGDVFIEKELLGFLEGRGEEYLVPEAVKQMTAKLKHSLSLQSKQLSESEARALSFDPRYCKDMFDNVTANLKKLHDMGATVGIGTDIGGTFSGFFGRYVDELKHFAAAGISNFDILRRATSVNARIIDMQDTVGSLEPGKGADIIAVRGDPLEDLRALDRVDMVMKGGVFVTTKGIDLS